jgi:hypothetical protein
MGYICAFVTPSMPGLVKIGATARDPAERLAEANAATTGRPPEPYYLACSFSVPIERETFSDEARALRDACGSARQCA